MRIQHNIMAMNAYRNYNTNTSALSKNLEKLSSGYKINRAGDDAAGLAISEKMRAQITGLNAASKNVKDGISLVKTAEGAMQEIQDMLNRMDYLATQSANGTYDNEVDRANLQKEVDQLKSEINRIADSANFNGIKLLDGSLDEGTKETTGPSGTFETLEMLGVSPTASIDGEKPSEGAKATITLTLKSGKAYNALGAVTGLAGNTLMLANLFDAVDADGNEIDLTSTSTVSADTTITLTAKTVGAFGATAFDTLANTTLGGTANSANFADIDATNGVDVGDPAASNTAAKYTINFKDLSKIQAGDKFKIGNIEFTFTMDKATNATNNFIQIDDLDLATGGTAGADWATLKDRIKDAIENANDGLGSMKASDSTSNAFKYAYKNLASTNSDDFTITLTTTDKGMAANGYQAPENWQHNGAFTLDFDPAKYSASDGKGKHATAVYDLGAKPEAGDKIKIGDKTIEFIENYDDYKKADGTIDTDKAWSEGKMIAKDFTTDNVNKILQSMHYEAGRVTINGNKISVEKGTADDTTAAKWAQGLGKVEFAKKVEETEGDDTTETAGPGKALTLQIGDTSDDYNQLKVAVGDMHTAALGIADLDISNIEGAQGAIGTIKAAINAVSSVRGDLGATQNRLEHTANNLSVMAENIQDAESTIRDTDVAEEMMAYTKNNILIQSAQAMLAQANAVPQGVLQLLG